MSSRRPILVLTAVVFLVASACGAGRDDDTPNAIDQRLEGLASAGV